MSNTTYEENEQFKKYSPLERQCMYSRGILNKKVVDQGLLRNILKDKFGKCLLTWRQRVELIKYYR